MKNKLFNLAVKLTTVSMIASMFMSALPASATVTVLSDAMSRQQGGVTATHTVTFTSDVSFSGNDDGSKALEILFTGFTGVGSLTPADVTVKVDGGAATALADDCTTAPGTQKYATAGAWTAATVRILFCTGGDVAATNVVVVTVGNPLAGQLTSPTAPISEEIVLTGTALMVGTAYVYLANADQVTIGAVIGQSMAFDVAVKATGACGAAKPTDPNTVSLGTIAYDDAHAKLSTAHICLLMDTNASGGMVVQVQGDNGAMASTSPADTVDSTTGALTPGTEGFGMCIYGVSPASNVGYGHIVKQAGAFASSVCGLDSTVAEVPIKTGDTWVSVANTAGAPIDGDGYTSVDAQVAMAVASSTLPSATYAEVWTFRATATF